MGRPLSRCAVTSFPEHPQHTSDPCSYNVECLYNRFDLDLVSAGRLRPVRIHDLNAGLHNAATRCGGVKVVRDAMNTTQYDGPAMVDKTKIVKAILALQGVSPRVKSRLPTAV
jgi:hypothetical protein